MKMKFWQKTYIFTLSLFLLCLNAGILALTVYTYKNNMDAAETAAAAEQYYIAVSFERDYADYTENTPMASKVLLMQTFGMRYGAKGIYLSFESEGEVVYSNSEHRFLIEKNTLLHTERDGASHIVLASEICDGKYVMVYAKNISSIDSEFRSLMLACILTAALISVVLATLLYFILKKLSEPLKRLRKTTETIESGDFSARALEQGNDEFTLLAKSFNLMLSKINGQMEALERESEKKQMLVDNMAHELRTPLTSIHGYAEFLEKAVTDEEKRIIAAKYIISESERLQKISEILLDSAFIRGNGVQMREMNVAEIACDTANRLAFKAESKAVSVDCGCAPLYSYGNETLLSMLLYNLVENAIKACDKGGRVKIYAFEDKLIIEDNGKGMTEEQLLHITEPFYRTDKSRSRAEGGAGLGLSLCKQIADTHGISMEFQSEIGVGTKLILTFTTRQ